MAARIVERARDHANRFNNYDKPVRDFIEANPGSTFAQISETDLTSTQLRTIIDVLENIALVIARPDFAGAIHYYTSKDWYNLITGEYENARTWVRGSDTDGIHSGRKEDEMAADLGVADAVALALADAMRNAGEAVTYADIG